MEIGGHYILRALPVNEVKHWGPVCENLVPVGMRLVVLFDIVDEISVVVEVQRGVDGASLVSKTSDKVARFLAQNFGALIKAELLDRAVADGQINTNSEASQQGGETDDRDARLQTGTFTGGGDHLR